MLLGRNSDVEALALSAELDDALIERYGYIHLELSTYINTMYLHITNES
jgi:hypothetical protein